MSQSNRQRVCRVVGFGNFVQIKKHPHHLLYLTLVGASVTDHCLFYLKRSILKKIAAQLYRTNKQYAARLRYPYACRYVGIEKKLFDGDGEKVDELERRIAHKVGMEKCFAVSGQTYPRKLDSRVLGALSGIAQSAYKFAQDLRLLQSFREVEEPFEKSQIGSSAMAYKRNPMRSERIASLSRYVICLLYTSPSPRD